MRVRILLKTPFSLQRHLNVRCRYFTLLNKTVCQHRCHPTMKEVQDPIIHSFPAYTQLVDALLQQICFGPPQLMTEFAQTLNLDHAFVLDLGRKCVEPLQHRDTAFPLPIENDPRSWQSLGLPQSPCMFLYLRLCFKIQDELFFPSDRWRPDRMLLEIPER